MPDRILVCGLNGAGKSTLGRQLAEKLSIPFMDAEDYYFPASDSDYTYANARTQQEAASLLLRNAKACSSFVFASVKGNFSEEFSSLLTCAVFIHVPKEIRMMRVRERSYRKFGCRMLEGGDLYEQENAFFNQIERRSEETVSAYLSSLSIPVIHVDGTRPIEENIRLLFQML